MGDGMYLGDDRLLALCGGFGFMAFYTEKMRLLWDRHLGTQVEYLKFSGEAKGGANIEEGKLPQVIRDGLAELIISNKIIRERLKSCKAKPLNSFSSGNKHLAVVMAMFNRRIYEHAGIEEILRGHAGHIDTLVPAIVALVMNKLALKSAAKGVPIPKELSEKRVSYMVHEVCKHHALYPLFTWGGGNSAFFTECAMEDAATGLAAKHIPSERILLRQKRKAIKAGLASLAGVTSEDDKSRLAEFGARKSEN